MTRPLDFPSTLAASVEHELVVSKSRFITHAHPLRDPGEASEIIADIRRRYWDARHHCLAMVTGLHGEQARSSDDGEPSGTAGAPMLAVLRHRRLTDLIVVVTRYFGGIKLGAGGLVRAYSTATSEALDRAALVQRVVLTEATIAVPHAEAGRFDNFLREWVATHDSSWDEPAYDSVATFRVWVPEEHLTALSAEVASVSAGALAAQFGRERIVDVPTGGGGERRES